MTFLSAKSMALAALALAPQAAHAAYRVNTTIDGDCFLNHFTFFNGSDPTNGFVQYVDQSEAMSSGMIELRDHDLANSSVYIGVDSTTTLPSASGPGRKSIRLQGTKLYTHGIVTLDVYHAPTGCGTWPALWMVNPSGTYPGTTGEIDIFETVNNSTANSMTLHTNEGCVVNPPPQQQQQATFQSNATMTGTLHDSNCWVYAPGQGNSGCSVTAPSSLPITPRMAGQSLAAKNMSYATAGAPFNAQAGGVFALVWTPTSIETYLFPRTLIPADLQPGCGRQNRTVDPQAWKAAGYTPLAAFAGCDFDDYLKDLALVVNTDFCGGWVDAEWESSGCAAQTRQSTCAAHVAASPEAFTEAYWLLGGMEVWSPQ